MLLSGRSRDPRGTTTNAPRRTREFTEDCRRVLMAARVAANERRASAVDTEHLLEAMLRQPKGDAAATLRRLGVDLEALRSRLDARADAPANAQGTLSMAGDLPYGARAKKALELAMTEARRQGNGPVGSGHLLIALLRDRRGRPARELAAVGVTLDRVGDLAAIHGSPGSARLAYRLRIDDRSGHSIHEQIVQQISEAVALGLLAGGDRLPAVRQLADELNIAPGTVARAYADLERRSVVETDRALGTRVAMQRTQSTPSGRVATLTELLRPIAVAAFHLGATGAELETALRRATEDIVGGSSSTRTPARSGHAERDE